MSETILEQLLLAEESLMQAEKHFLEAKTLKRKLRQQRTDGKLIYENWRGTPDWGQWRTEQLERQKWQCACCGKPMKFGTVAHQANGGINLNPEHPTVEHILPKSYFPELALDKQNLVMNCWDCNKRKGNSLAKASRFRYQQLKQKLQHFRIGNHCS